MPPANVAGGRTMESKHRITEIGSVAAGNFFAVIYALFGLIHALPIVFGAPDKVGVPVGYYFPPFELKLTLNLAASTPAMRLVAAGATVLGFTVSGWLSGAVTAFAFNVVAAITGGVPASFVPETRTEE
jgi:hypothetical protein